jgi:4-amino-4-deoxy-L-arabinose transferase-like glycosyltransferase
MRRFAPSAEPAWTWRTGVLLFVVVLLLAVPQAALLPLLDRDEPRFAEASREMLQSGNFVVPTFDHAPRYAKPPLIYWAQAGAFKVFGENALAARLPSLLATAGTAVILFAWGTALGSGWAGVIAGFCYALCLQVMQQGRVATADALLIFFVTLTGFAGWQWLSLGEGEKPRAEGGTWWGSVLALGFAGGFLAKGPEALLPILPLLWAARKRGKRVLGALGAIFLLGLFVVTWWAIPAFVETDGAYWREGLGHDVGDRMVTGFQGHGASSLGWYFLELPLYFVLFWVSALPWSPLLWIRRKALFEGWRPDATDVYLLLNAALFFGVFSLMVTKLPHYTLPAFPFLALGFARRSLVSGRRGVVLEGMLFFGVGMALAALVLVPWVVMPQWNPSPTGELVREAGSALRPETAFAVVDFQEPNLIWEMRRVVRGYGEGVAKSGAAVEGFLREPGPRAVVLTTRAWEGMRAEVGMEPGWRVFSAQGFNAAKLRGMDLTIVVKPE